LLKITCTACTEEPRTPEMLETKLVPSKKPTRADRAGLADPATSQGKMSIATTAGQILCFRKYTRKEYRGGAPCSCLPCGLKAPKTDPGCAAAKAGHLGWKDTSKN